MFTQIHDTDWQEQPGSSQSSMECEPLTWWLQQCVCWLIHILLKGDNNPSTVIMDLLGEVDKGSAPI